MKHDCMMMIIGDIGIKSLVQVMAASMAELESLTFYCFGDEKFKVEFEKWYVKFNFLAFNSSIRASIYSFQY